MRPSRDAGHCLALKAVASCILGVIVSIAGCGSHLQPSGGVAARLGIEFVPLPPCAETARLHCGRTEVTRGQWKAVMHSEPWQQAAGAASADADDQRLPVTGVSAREAIDFCTRLTAEARADGSLSPREAYRLLTPEEWAWAAAGSDAGNQPDAERLQREAWIRIQGGPRPVATRVASAWGLFDMYGNVWEKTWTASEPGQCVNVGGAWNTGMESCLASEISLIDHASADIGFRVARGEGTMAPFDGRAHQ